MDKGKEKEKEIRKKSETFARTYSKVNPQKILLLAKDSSSNLASSGKKRRREKERKRLVKRREKGREKERERELEEGMVVVEAMLVDRKEKKERERERETRRSRSGVRQNLNPFNGDKSPSRTPFHEVVADNL